MSPDKGVQRTLVALFFATGACGLALQVLWAKAFATGIGHEFPAVLAVITAFMGGFASGATFYRQNRFFQARLTSYGLLEIIVGLWAALSIVAIPATSRIVVKILGIDPAPSFHWLIVFAFVFLTLFPATAAMGATLPAVERLISNLGNNRAVGLLYAANTAGATTGALGAAFFLMPALGIPNSILLCALINVVAGLAAFLLAPRQTANLSAPRRKYGDVSGEEFLVQARREEGAYPQRSVTDEQRSLRRKGPPGTSPYLRLGAPSPLQPESFSFALPLRLFLSGFLGIAFETVIIRGLSQILENTVFTFAAVLSVFLLATAFGATLQQRFQQRLKIHWLFAGVGLACAISGLILRALPTLYLRLRGHLGDSLPFVALAEVIVSSTVLFLPATFMGAAFSTLASESLARERDLSWAFAINTFGAALPPAFVGLLLIPFGGLKISLLVISVAYVLLSAKSLIVLALPLAALISIFAPNGADLLRLGPEEKILFFKEGAMASTAVIENAKSDRVLKVNNRFQMGGTAARVAEQRHADIPLLLHPNPKRALFIGLGTSITFQTAALHPELVADGVELLPEVVESAGFFQEPGQSSDSARLNIHVADGRRFVLAARDRYDVIVADLFHPAQDGAGFLYTREHFAAVKSRLSTNGLFCQWLPLFQIDLETLRIITRTFLEVFPHAESWLLRFNVDTPVVGLIGISSDYRPDIIETRTRFQELQDHLRRVGLPDTLRLYGCYLAGPNELLDFSRNAPLNTDAHPIVMFRAPYLAFKLRDDPGQRLLALLNSLPVTAPPVGDHQFNGRISKFISARNLYLQGLVIEGRGEPQEAAKKYLESVRTSSEFTPAYAQAVSIATAVAGSNRSFAERVLLDLAEAAPQIPVARELLEKLK